MAPARGWGGARRWKSREKQRQNTVKKNNRRDHRRPGRRIIRILKRKGETFRIALLWGGDGRGVADSHLFQPNKHNQSIHQCCCKLCPYKNCIKGGCFSSVHHRRFQWTRLLGGHCSKHHAANVFAEASRGSARLMGGLPASPRRPAPRSGLPNPVCAGEAVSMAPFLPTTLHLLFLTCPRKQPWAPSKLSDWFIWEHFYPRVHRLTFSRQIPRWAQKQGPTAGKH